MRTLLILTLTASLSGCSAVQSNPAQADAKTMKNPVAATAQSIANGKRLFDRFCANCHGAAGNGVSEMASTLAKIGKIKPSDLTDDKWDHGSTDGEIFVDIRDGVGPNAAMRGLNGKPGISDEEMWHIVNYVRSIGPKAR